MEKDETLNKQPNYMNKQRNYHIELVYINRQQIDHMTYGSLL